MQLKKITVKSLPRGFSQWKYYPKESIMITVASVQSNHEHVAFIYNLQKPLILQIGDYIIYPLAEKERLPDDFVRTISAEFMTVEDYKGESQTGDGTSSKPADTAKLI